MRKFLLGLAALPFLASIASAGQPLTNEQMDQVTAAGTVTFTNAQGQPFSVCACFLVPYTGPTVSTTTVAAPQLGFGGAISSPTLPPSFQNVFGLDPF